MSQFHWLNDLSKLASSAFSTAGDIQREAGDTLRFQLEKILLRMNLVSRDEFEAVRQMATEARQAQLALEARIAALEAARTAPVQKKTMAKSTSGKMSTRKP